VADGLVERQGIPVDPSLASCSDLSNSTTRSRDDERTRESNQ
jgi:hypothetical protein